MIQQNFRDFPTIFVRLKGLSGVVREYQALVVPTSEYCIIPPVDAFALGYPVAGGSDVRSFSPNQLHFASYSGYARGVSLKMLEVDIAGTTFKDVEFVAVDILQAAGFDVVIGKSLLQNTKLQLDYGSHQMTLEKAVTA
ncbi:MAG: hypothetical protein JRN52_06975 [Nitrososphaerota archaeon]|nr:hypothetical protein [Nitrososphaerota archaeon]